MSRIRSYRLPGVAQAATAEKALRTELTNRGLQPLGIIQSREEMVPFFARLGQMRAFLSASELVVKTDDKILDDEYRCLDWWFDGPLAVPVDEGGPGTWFSLPVVDNLVFAGETALTNVDLILKNFDERLRIALTAEIERHAGGWRVTAVSVTGSTHGELLEIWAPMVHLRYQLRAPDFGWELDDAGDGGWYAAAYSFDGRIVGARYPKMRQKRAVIVAAIAFALAVLLGLFVVAFFLFVFVS